MNIKYYEFVAPFLPQLSGTQNALFLRRFFLKSVGFLALPYSSTLSHKQHDIRGEKELLNINSVI
jgi:hypothetical protein